MTILECLNLLPDDLTMIDLVTFDENKKHKTVSELKQGSHVNESGYEIIEYRVNSKINKRQIGFRKKNGNAIIIYREL